MKWLILILLVSCGHEQPPKKDIADSDGDHIPNYLEASSELIKYTAEVIPFGKTEGTLTFKVDNKYISIPVANKSNTPDQAMKLLTRSRSALRTGDYFSEWALLRLDESSLQVPDGNYHVTLALETEDRPEFLMLEDGKAKVELTPFSQRMEFQLTGHELRDILSRKLHFSLSNHGVNDPYTVEGNVRERTYRVYFFDGRIGRIHYVSRELDFSRYLKLIGIKESFELRHFRGFTQNDDRPFWWTRTLSENDRVVVKSSLTKLSEFHRSNFQSQEARIDRRNGKSGAVHKVSKARDTKFILKLRGTRSLHTFRESSRSYTVGGARGELNESCREWKREILRTQNSPVTKADLLSELILKSENKTLTLNELSSMITEGSDSKGWYLEVALDETPADFTVELKSRPASSFHKTGVYRRRCTHTGDDRGGNDTNDEGHLQLQVESFIEKID